MAKKKNADSVLELEVAFGNVSIGDKTARVGISTERSQISISQADKNLCGRRLTGTILVHANENPDQTTMDGFADDIALPGIFDVKQIGITPKAVGFGLTFALAGLDVSQLAHFAKRNGKLIVNNVEDIPENEQNGHAEEES